MVHAFLLHNRNRTNSYTMSRWAKQHRKGEGRMHACMQDTINAEDRQEEGAAKINQRPAKITHTHSLHIT